MTTIRLLTATLVAAIFLLVPALSPASVTVGPSSWYWGNPLPQGRTINAIEFVGSRGYAAGNFGTVLRTDDRGATWSRAYTGNVRNLWVLRTVGADTLIVGDSSCNLYRSDDAGQSFERLPLEADAVPCPHAIHTFHFPSSSVGYILVSDGIVFRTADGGQSWSQKAPVPNTMATGGQSTANDIFFIGDNSGFVVTSGGQIYRSTDGGSSWTEVVSAGASLNGIYFADATTGYAVGNSSTVLKSTDGGATWQSKFGGHTDSLMAIRCTGATTCLATVWGGDKLLRTWDGGDSWTSSSPSTQPLNAAAFTSATRAVAAGADGSMVASDDAGANWSAVGSRLGGTYTQLRTTANDADVAYAAGRKGALARTADGGRSWQNVGVSTDADVIDVSFPKPSVGFALDSSGSAFRTDDSGASWRLLDTGTSREPNAILALDADRVLLIGPKGVRRSLDGGEHFNAAGTRALSRAKLDDRDLAGKNVFVYGKRKLFISKNGGRSWRKVRRPRGRLKSVDFVSSEKGYAITKDGRLWRTRNRGKHWHELEGIGSSFGRVVAFGTEKRGFVLSKRLVADTGESKQWLAHTSDGGKTWRRQLTLYTVEGSGALAASSRSTAFALINEFYLLATRRGGDAGASSTLTIKPSRRKLHRKATIKVTGKLRPADGGEQVMVAGRGRGHTTWKSKWVEVAADGTFSLKWKVKRTTVFVAQWSGDADNRGDGTRVVKVRVKKKRNRSSS